MNKRFTLKWSFILFILSFLIPPLSSQTPTASIATWKDNKKAAYTIIHDDYSNYVTGIFQHADPIATARGIKLCFGAITNYCGATEWANARTMIAHGHECVNHSHNHKCGGSASECSGLTTYSTADFATELGTSTQLIQSNTGVKPRFFIHPYDAGTTNVLNYLSSLGYLGTRLGTREALNPSSFTNYMRLNYHVYSPTTPIASLNQVVDQAITSGGYAIREFHGIDDGSWAAMTVTNYTNHLNYVKTQMDNGNLWSATATEAITYKMQRDAYQPVVSYNATNGTINISFTTLAAIDPTLLTTPITLNINLNGIAKNYNASQNGTAIASTKVGNTISVNVYPHKGNIVLNCTDCSIDTPPSDITKLSATPQPNAVLVSWSNPTTSFNNVLVVAKEGSGFTTKPTAVSYTANANFAGSASAFEGGKVMYQGTGTNVQVTGLTAGRTYYFAVYVLSGTTWSNGTQISAVPTGSTGSTTYCLQASYYNNTTLSGTPVAVRYETSINYDWGTNAPNVAGVVANNFSIRWKGNFTVTKTGYYAFTTRADDGVKLWVNNSLLINRWNDQVATSYTSYIYLSAGVKYPIQMDYYERSGYASAKLSWGLWGQSSQIMTFSSNCVTNNLANADAVSLDGRLENGKANLQWVVRSNNEIDYYQVEKMNSQGEFSPIGIVNDLTRSNQINRLFSFKDEKLDEGENIYRIQTYFVGNTPPQYSNHLTINNLKTGQYTIYPNPASEMIQIDLSSDLGKSGRVRIFSLLGQEVYQETLGQISNKIHTVYLDKFEAGQYLIRIEIDNKKAQSQKLIINH